MNWGPDIYLQPDALDAITAIVLLGETAEVSLTPGVAEYGAPPRCSPCEVIVRTAHAQCFCTAQQATAWLAKCSGYGPPYAGGNFIRGWLSAGVRNLNGVDRTTDTGFTAPLGRIKISQAACAFLVSWSDFERLRR